MATVQFGDHGGNLSTPVVHDTVITTATSTFAEEISPDGWRFTSTGEFTGAGMGTMTSYTGYVPDGSLAYSISGIHVDVSLFYNYVNTGNAYGLVTLLASGADTVTGGAGDDTARGAAGNDSFDGRGGVDTAVYGNTRATYTITRTALDTWRVASSVDGTDTMTNVERLQFTDMSLAFDLTATGHAGQTALIIGAAFGTSYLTVEEYVGIGLGLFDGGTTMDELCEIVLRTPLFRSLSGTPSDVDFVNLVYKNVVGELPSTADRDYYVNMLEGSGGTLSQAELLKLAAISETNVAHIGLVGMQAGGIEYA